MATESPEATCAVSALLIRVHSKLVELVCGQRLWRTKVLTTNQAVVKYTPVTVCCHGRGRPATCTWTLTIWRSLGYNRPSYQHPVVPPDPVTQPHRPLPVASTRFLATIGRPVQLRRRRSCFGRLLSDLFLWSGCILTLLTAVLPAPRPPCSDQRASLPVNRCLGGYLARRRRHYQEVRHPINSNAASDRTILGRCTTLLPSLIDQPTRQEGSVKRQTHRMLAILMIVAMLATAVTPAFAAPASQAGGEGRPADHRGHGYSRAVQGDRGGA